MDNTFSIAGDRSTIWGVIDTDRITLLGVAGRADDRRALVRLPSGRVRTVTVGDRLNGGRVLAIGPAELRYHKAGCIRVLTLPH